MYLGKFPRLADIIDRLDPLARVIKNSGLEKNYIIAPFEGYPNKKLIELYSKFFNFQKYTGFINNILWKKAMIINYKHRGFYGIIN